MFLRVSVVPAAASASAGVTSCFSRCLDRICGGGEEGSGGMSAQSELFLRVLVEFWLEGNTVLRPGVLKEVTTRRTERDSEPRVEQ